MELIGLMYEKGKIDCWGLCVLAFKKFLGVDIELFKGCDATGEELNRILASEKANPMWERTEKAEKNCLVVCDKNGVNEHVGYMLDTVHVLHSMQGYGSRVDKVLMLKKIGYNLEFYRLRGING